MRIDTRFSRVLPLDHEYIKTFIQYREEFGGANRILIAITTKHGDIFTPEFFSTLEKVTDAVFFIPGVDRSRIRSLFTPNVRFIEIIEDGFSGGNVVQADFQPTESGLEQVKKNILKAGLVGRLVANDFSGALINVQLLELDPRTGKHLDHIKVAQQLEEKIRNRFTNENGDLGFDYHIIGFAKAIGDIADGAIRAMQFFTLSFFVSTVLVFIYCQSIKLTIILLTCSVTGVVWQLGLMGLMGFGLDPMSVLVPFLIFAIALSHGVQLISTVRGELLGGSLGQDAVRNSFKYMLKPGSIALVSDAIGFLAIWLIEIKSIQETAISAALGVTFVIVTNLILLSVLLSYVHYDMAYREKISIRLHRQTQLWDPWSRSVLRFGTIILFITGGLVGLGVWKAADVRIGDLHKGIAELHADSRYNIDSDVIDQRFAIGIDVLTVFVETIADGCVDYNIMTAIDRFAWHIEKLEGVRSVESLPGKAKVINAGWNEGDLKWRVLPRNPAVMAQAVSPITTDTGLLNADCSVMQIFIFTKDHKAQTIARIVQEIRNYRESNPHEQIRFRLAGGNVGVMAATNETISDAQFRILFYVFTAVVALCLIYFQSVKAVVCIVLPLAVVSLLAYALMALLEIGLKVNTLPVVALGVGIGVDYGIYMYTRLSSALAAGKTVADTYISAMTVTGSGVIFTGLTLVVAVAIWIFSPLKFQSDMGVLLTFMFLSNMLGAVVLLPVLAGRFCQVELR